ncbi:MAG: hypothetical protein LBD23_04290 [Oscillospiraceae bacterium]|nr:hypothetical protein [Oscillospiraceae bacterium]
MIYNKNALTVSAKLLEAVKRYIDEHYIDEHYVEEKEQVFFRQELYSIDSDAYFGADMADMSTPEMYTSDMPMMVREAPVTDTIPAPGSAPLDDLVGNLDEPFSKTLLRLIDTTGKKDSEIYNRANIDRRLFSKIRNNTQYTPSKPTVLAFAIALELNLDQTEDLLERAGFALSRSRKFDVIMEYFIRNQKYNIFEINEVLLSYDQPLLGG